ncbi:MAG TPA: CPBP family intramembrane glutamic endopeptidase [Sedimentisphaerales bacterium]|nr:CPBP family intramembrane glutamic endopeptidase [Sedimentisphaerales bacterium]
MNEPDIEQVEQHLAAVPDEERRDTFRQIPWSLKDCCIALGVIAIFRVAFHVLGLVGLSDLVYTVGMAIWVLMFGWMFFFPLWIAHKRDMLRRPAVGFLLKESGLAIPLAVGLILVEWLFMVILYNVTGSSIEESFVLSGLRDAPNDARWYLLLVPMFTIGPIAEELLFRGLLYNALRRRVTPLIAVVLQALVFALVHYHMPETSIIYVFTIFFSGIVLAGVYEWRKTIWNPIALHVLMNFAFAGPVIVLMILNSHTPAKTWQQAELPPDWLGTDFTGIERMPTGEEQRLYAINTWGSSGLRMWKKEIQAFQAVCKWFPEDRQACAKARSGIARIYESYLRDPRRAIVESDRILSEFRNQPEVCAEVLITRGWSYYDLGDVNMSRASFQEVVGSYPSYEWAQQSAAEGLRMLDGR